MAYSTHNRNQMLGIRIDALSRMVFGMCLVHRATSLSSTCPWYMMRKVKDSSLRLQKMEPSPQQWFPRSRLRNEYPSDLESNNNFTRSGGVYLVSSGLMCSLLFFESLGPREDMDAFLYYICEDRATAMRLVVVKTPSIWNHPRKAIYDIQVPLLGLARPSFFLFVLDFLRWLYTVHMYLLVLCSLPVSRSCFT